MITGTMPTPEKLLEMYTDLILQMDQVKADKQHVIDQILPKSVRDQLDDVEAEFETDLASLRAKQKMVEDQLRHTVINTGVKKVQGSTYTATLVKGRTSWDTKTLEGMVALVPQIEVARKIGNPSVRITMNKGGAK